jgi:hypothetical protein
LKKENVRCWKIGINHEQYVTYPESHMGHKLICCRKCGAVYAVNVARLLYVEPDLDRHLEKVNCLECASVLANNWLSYPDNYVEKDGSIGKIERPLFVPSDDKSIIVAFYEVFS